MSSRNRKPGVVRIICTDKYHHDTPGYAERGFYYLGTTQVRKYGPDLRRPAQRFVDDTMFLKAADLETAFGVARIRESYEYVLRFRCPCGLDYQRGENFILDRIAQYFAAKPGVTRFDLDITTL